MPPIFGSGGAAMAYLKPPAFQRLLFNKLAMRFGFGGSQTLVTTGRKSGKPVSIPVVPVTVRGQKYLVSTRGEAFWVKNLRASGAGELRAKGKVERFQATEVPIAERPPIIEAYRPVAGRVVEGYFKQLPDPADHPVFRLDPLA